MSAHGFLLGGGQLAGHNRRCVRAAASGSDPLLLRVARGEGTDSHKIWHSVDISSAPTTVATCVKMLRWLVMQPTSDVYIQAMEI